MTTIYRRVSVTTTITIGVSFLAAGLAEQIDLSCLDRSHECQLTYLPVNATQPEQQHTPDDGENGSNFPTLNNELSASGVNVNSQVVSYTSDVDLILPSSPATFDYDQYIASRLRRAGINVTIRLSSSESATATSVNLRNVSGVDGWSEVT